MPAPSGAYVCNYHTSMTAGIGAILTIVWAKVLKLGQTRDSHFPDIDRPVVAMAKAFAAGTHVDWHRHARCQLIFGIRGLMLVRTERGAWVVPAGYVLWMPANVRHHVTMRGDVDMRTIYVEQSAASAMPKMCIVVGVSDLLRSALVALSTESHNYEVRGRGGHLVAIVLDEIERAPAPPFALVIPHDPRIARIARALIKDPGSTRDLDSWAAWVGVSRRNLTRVFRQQTGLSFGAWRRRLRLLEAAARLADGESLDRIVATLGYSSVEAFQTMQRRETDRA
jgi:AraC-like DNA-binding protein